MTIRATIIVVVHAGARRLDDAVASLEGVGRRPDVEVVVVDNGSTDHLAEVARRRFPWARPIRSDVNLGFAGGVRLGVDAAGGDVLCLLNDDAAASDTWLDAHLAALDANPDAAATAGRLTDWEGGRHDFVRGAVTFDAHAFQVGQGRPLDEVGQPAEGEPVPFACGGNLAIRRADWELAGGFDPELFAYFEDVELGWRLWAAGRPVVAAPGAVARHRGMATSNALGNYRRGVLFERNALRVFFANADDEHRAALAPAVLATFLHRLAAFTTEDPTAAALLADPFGPVAAPPGRGERWRRRFRERGVAGTLRHAMARLVGGPSAGAPALDDGLLVMQLRAAAGFFAGLDATTSRRRALDAIRRLSDHEILARFPRFIVPTYRGDDAWFASEGFRALLPEGWPLSVPGIAL